MKEGKTAHTRRALTKPKKTAAKKSELSQSSAAPAQAKKKPAPHPKHSEVVSVSQIASPNGSVEITPEERAVLVAQVAYFRAESRGFVAGYELDDWYAAEAEITEQLARVS